MKLVCIGLILFLCLPLVVNLNARARPVGDVPMLQCSGLPCVDLTLSNGKKMRMAIDTGDEDSIMDVSVAKQFGFEVQHPANADGKPAGDDYVVLRDVKLGAVSLGEIKVSVLEGIAARMKSARMPASDGLLAYTAFKDRLLQLDYRRHRVAISSLLHLGTACPRSCGHLTTPSFGKHGPAVLVTKGFSVNDKEVTAQIDTLFSGSMLIYSAAVEKLGLGELAQTTQKRFFNYTDGGVDMLQGKPQRFAFARRVLAESAPLYFSTQGVHEPDGMFDACVGQELFSDSVLNLDLHNMTIWISN
jgi:hypothetical protein